MSEVRMCESVPRMSEVPFYMSVSVRPLSLSRCSLKCCSLLADGNEIDAFVRVELTIGYKNPGDR